MKRLKTTRRQFIKTAALATAALTAPPFIRRSHAAGKLSVALWDHWVPASNDVHDVFMLPQQYPSILRDSLEPLDDIAAEIQKSYGQYSVVAEYACKIEGVWRAVPAPTGSHSYP